MLNATKILVDENYKIKKEEFINLLKKLSKKYDLIIIDNSSECFFDYTKEILRNSDLILFILEPNLIEIEKKQKFIKYLY
jgi:Flp pilus assembly CpaE family ATPase